ncbi:MAG: hypothetical protein HQ504_04595 [Rhodospirillaceae bacterium]|nr:hypothetical protein [Rhodospirillaceae bacterium]
MVVSFHTMIQDSWDVWSGLFSPLPYGDPYMASAVLLGAIAYISRQIFGNYND